MRRRLRAGRARGARWASIRWGTPTWSGRAADTTALVLGYANLAEPAIEEGSAGSRGSLEELVSPDANRTRRQEASMTDMKDRRPQLIACSSARASAGEQAPARGAPLGSDGGSRGAARARRESPHAPRTGSVDDIRACKRSAARHLSPRRHAGARHRCGRRVADGTAVRAHRARAPARSNACGAIPACSSPRARCAASRSERRSRRPRGLLGTPSRAARRAGPRRTATGSDRRRVRAVDGPAADRHGLPRDHARAWETSAGYSI